MRPVAPVRLDRAALEAAATRARLTETAEAFEALLVQSLLKSMSDAQLEDGFFGDGPGASTYQAVFQEQLADTLSHGSPLGIARMIERQWAGRLDAADDAAVALREAAEARARAAYGAAIDASGGAASGAAPTPAPAPVPEAPAHPDRPRRSTLAPSRAASPVSSPFGWRNDPFDGSLRFHRGVDLPAPRGTAVVSVAPGEVVFAGRRAGFGLEVVVRHEEGWITRYAHLSGTAVRPGQKVGRGSLLGEVGSTGRSTGPHLHFEAAREGRTVDPAVAAPGSLRTQVLRDRADET